MAGWLRRAALYLVTAWVALTIGFVVPRLAPGDPAQAVLARFPGRLDPAGEAALRRALGGSDEPLAAQYVSYLGATLRGDLGTSAAYFPAPVGDVIATGLGWTVFLTGGAVVLSFVLGGLLGILCAWRRGGWLDRTLPPLFALLGAFPYFWLAMLLLHALGYHLRWFPLRHAHGPHVVPGLDLDFALSAARHAILPAATIVLATVGGWLFTMRSAMLATLRADYVTLARAKGLSERRIMLCYAAPNAVLPGLAGFGMALGFVLSGSLLTEIVFAYPGLGRLLVQAVRNQDYPLMQGLFLVTTLAVLVANFLVDVASGLLDPRVGAER